MKLSYATYELEFRHPFGLSHSTRTSTPTVYLKIEHEGQEGYGEATLPPYLGETQESVVLFFRQAVKLFSSECREPLDLLPKIAALSAGNMAAKAAIDIALHDLVAKLSKQAVHQLLHLPAPVPKETSVTIAIGDLSLIPDKIEELKAFGLLKVKLGHPNDREIVARIRQYTDKPIVVDVNQGWPAKEAALEMIAWLAGQNTLYVEQPLPKNNPADMAWLRQRSPLPLLADESFQRLSDLDAIAGSFHGINLKLMKCGGLAEGARIVDEAKRLGLRINIGCMSESSCGIAAAAQLMRQADWIDLDGPLLITNDPFTGITFDRGLLHLGKGGGLGIKSRKSVLQFLPL